MATFEAELLPAVAFAARKVAKQTRSDQAAMAARVDRDRWIEGERLLECVQQAADTLAEQINPSSTPDPS